MDPSVLNQAVTLASLLKTRGEIDRYEVVSNGTDKCIKIFVSAPPYQDGGPIVQAATFTLDKFIDSVFGAWAENLEYMEIWEEVL